MRAELSFAGLPLRPSEFIGLIGGSVALLVTLGTLLGTSAPGYVILAILGIAIPIIVLKYLQNKRRSTFTLQVAD
ncbi:MAG: hypothetical protein ACYC08_08280, partial [Armatimonadota bacterium]